MGKLGQTWQTTKEYRKTYLGIPCLFTIISFIIQFQTKSGEIAMSKIIFWIEWVFIPALIGLVGVFLWHYFIGTYVKVEAEIIKISPYDYYARAFGISMNEGDKEMITNITLIPSKPVEVSKILLRLSGKCFDAKEYSSLIGGMIPFSTREIKSAESYELSFDIPKESAVNSNNARIFAIAKNIKRFSKPLVIDFGE